MFSLRETEVGRVDGGTEVHRLGLAAELDHRGVQVDVLEDLVARTVHLVVETSCDVGQESRHLEDLLLVVHVSRLGRELDAVNNEAMLVFGLDPAVLCVHLLAPRDALQDEVLIKLLGVHVVQLEAHLSEVQGEHVLLEVSSRRLGGVRQRNVGSHDRLRVNSIVQVANVRKEIAKLTNLQLVLFDILPRSLGITVRAHKTQ